MRKRTTSGRFERSSTDSSVSARSSVSPSKPDRRHGLPESVRLWRARRDSSPRRLPVVSVWLRGTRRSHRFIDVPEPSGKRTAKTADGTACTVRVERPRVVGATILSPFQRVTYEPASYFRDFGSVVESEPPRRNLPALAGRGCQSGVSRLVLNRSPHSKTTSLCLARRSMYRLSLSRATSVGPSSSCDLVCLRCSIVSCPLYS